MEDYIEKYGVNGHPRTYLLDPEGIINARNLRREELVNRVKNLIKEQ
ncbi:MAG: hypothetical protein R3243_03185 [Arenibacter latericius]|nr:hypothetical protein [Arenibacter latericius]